VNFIVYEDVRKHHDAFTLIVEGKLSQLEFKDMLHSYGVVFDAVAASKDML
jgi:hypothetical protein